MCDKNDDSKNLGKAKKKFCKTVNECTECINSFDESMDKICNNCKKPCDKNYCDFVQSMIINQLKIEKAKKGNIEIICRCIFQCLTSVLIIAAVACLLCKCFFS